jgi:HEPN domain-containing protein
MPTHHTTSGALVAGSASIGIAHHAQQLFERASALHAGLEALAPLGAKQANAAVFLASWCLELALKSHLAAHGQGKRELRSIQHNLTALWSKAASLGLHIASAAPRWCEKLSETHDDPYHQRYATDKAASIAPNIQAVANELRLLLEVVSRSIQ